jgi:hypothetical protein
LLIHPNYKKFVSFKIQAYFTEYCLTKIILVELMSFFYLSKIDFIFSICLIKDIFDFPSILLLFRLNNLAHKTIVQHNRESDHINKMITISN